MRLNLSFLRIFPISLFFFFLDIKKGLDSLKPLFMRFPSHLIPNFPAKSLFLFFSHFKWLDTSAKCGLFHYLYLSDLPKLSKNFFTPSKNPEDFGACLLKSLPCKLSSSLWSNSFCSLVKLTGVSTTIRQIKSPA